MEAVGKPSLRAHYEGFGERIIPREDFGSLNGKLSALSSRVMDILRRERQSVELLRGILDHSPFPMMLIDERHRVTFSTPGASALLGGAEDGERPIGDLEPLSLPPALIEDVEEVLRGNPESRRQISLGDHSYLCCIAPCRVETDEKINVLLTFMDLVEIGSQILPAPGAGAPANDDPQLQAASRNLRQPLQALMLIQALVAKRADEADRTLSAELGRSLLMIKAFVDAVEDVRRLKDGLVRPTITDFPLAPFFEELRSDFAAAMADCGVEWRVMACDVTVRSDPRLLRRMIEALLLEAIKQGLRGKLLLGCRCAGAAARIEFWRTETVADPGIGGDPAPFALGVDVAKRLSLLLDHPLAIRSRPEAGLFASFELNVASNAAFPLIGDRGLGKAIGNTSRAILVVSQDSHVLHLLQGLLSLEGHDVAAVADGGQAVALLAPDKEPFRPELAVIDQTGSGFRGGAETIYRLRQKLGVSIPALILVPDASEEDKQRASQQGCLLLRKPIATPELLKLIARGLPRGPMPASASRRRNAGGRTENASRACVLIGKDFHDWSPDPSLCPEGLSIVRWSTGEEFLAAEPEQACLCLIVDADLPGIGGIELLDRIKKEGPSAPAIVLVKSGDVATAVRAVKAGAAEVLEKPIDKERLAQAVGRLAASATLADGPSSRRQEAVFRIRHLTQRQRQVLELMLEGRPNKDIAAKLGISLRTVESHRAAVMHRTGSHSMVDLMRVVQTAAGERRGLRLDR